MRNLLRGPFEAAIAFAAVVATVTWLIDPGAAQQAAVGKTSRELLPVWEVLYGVGGAAILFGLLAESVRAEVAGLALLVAALAINAISIVSFAQASGAASAATFAALSAAGVARAWFLWSGYKQLAADESARGG